jgi:hypothetical protein
MAYLLDFCGFDFVNPAASNVLGFSAVSENFVAAIFRVNDFQIFSQNR